MVCNKRVNNQPGNGLDEKMIDMFHGPFFGVTLYVFSMYKNLLYLFIDFNIKMIDKRHY